MNPKSVFTYNELDLKEAQVYGFDYDYTLTCYKPSMDNLLYSHERDMRIQKYKIDKCFIIQNRKLLRLVKAGEKFRVDSFGCRNKTNS